MCQDLPVLLLVATAVLLSGLPRLVVNSATRHGWALAVIDIGTITT